MVQLVNLNVGAGLDIRAGWLNCDRVALPGIDLVFDVESFPWPIAAGSVTRALLRDVLEHTSTPVLVLEEVARVLVPGGTVEIQVPHFTSRVAHLDPTHVRSFSCESFDFLTVGHARSYYIKRPFERVTFRRISFGRSPLLPWNYILESLVNRSIRTMRAYESTPLRAFPALNVHIEMRSDSSSLNL